jgi:hypothetical protein
VDHWHLGVDKMAYTYYVYKIAERTNESERDTDREKTSSGKRVHTRIEHRRNRGGARSESFVSEAKAYHYGSARKGDDPSPW